ncbi:IucC family-domain-containing protein [Penicillium angulare]|uniref:IucC family-domain-containing protein n=1 Tax=Penicillium angulare TaxID=116970 RepID=A0A9W9FCI0_9EURO|nr:IucC family-domain-containing protein [Penicillium angulare]
MRTISLLPEMNFPFHLKMSLNCQITSTVRNVNPWATFLGPLLSKILPNLVSPDLWLFEEPASITGAQDNATQAGYLSCIIRKLPEQQAKAPEEVLIPATGLYQTPSNDDRTYMEIFFGLNSLKKKQEWFRKYISLLLPAVIDPLVQYGIGFESHLQNIIVRVNSRTRELVGLAIRDMDGSRIHYPTFRCRAGYDLISGMAPGGHHILNDLRAVLHHVHKTLIQENAGHILYTLGLEPHGGWSIVRDELEKVLEPLAEHDGKVVHDFLLEETMPLYRFLGMRLFGRVTEDFEVNLPNFLLRGI